MTFTIKKDDEGLYIDILDLKDYYDVDQIDSYTVGEVDGNIVLTVYDKDQNVILPKKPITIPEVK